MQINHFDEAVDWSNEGVSGGRQVGYEKLCKIAAGNLGWAYYQLGDDERALEQFASAQRKPRRGWAMSDTS